MNTATMIPIIRHVLQIIAGILIAKGWLTDKEAADLTAAGLEFAGPVIGLGTIAWMVWEKKRKPTPAAPAIIAAGLMGIALGGAGCSAILPGNDAILVNAERTTVLAVAIASFGIAITGVLTNFTMVYEHSTIFNSVRENSSFVVGL